MKFDFLENNLLIITPSSYKKEILKYLTDNNLILNIKFMSMNEYLKKIFFDYDEMTIHYLVKKGMKVDNAISIINNLYYIEDKNYDNEKLDYLVSIKRELDNNNLLIYDHLFNKMLSKYKVVIYGYGNLGKWQKNLFLNAKIIPFSKMRNQFEIYKIKDISDEVEFIFQSIANLLTEGIDINKISIMNIDNEYLPILKRYAIFYQIPLSIPNNETLLGTTIGKEFLNILETKKDLDVIEKELSKYKNNVNYQSIINILNKYVSFNIEDFLDEIKYDLANTKVNTRKYDDTIKIKPLFDYVSDDEYVFLANFNNTSIPCLSLDIDYITDNIKNLVGLDETYEKNVLSKENTLSYLQSIHNLVISYKETSPFNTYYPSILLDDIKYFEKEYTRSFNYSDMANKCLYAMYLDDYIKYGIKNKDLDKLYTSYGENNYLSYNNAFTGIDKDKLINYLNNELTLSYSSIDNYYKCCFKYYLSNVLKVDLYEETFMTIIGSLFHDVLRHMNDEDFNLDTSYNNFLKDKEFTSKEKFFIDKLKNDLAFIIEVIKKHQFISGFTNMLYEEKIDITLKQSPYVHFKGFVDKIMYKEKNDETLVSIIDYKTGNPDIKIKNLEFGLSMQLPVYLYLVHNSHLFKKMSFTGFYLQHILNISVKKDKKSAEEQKYNNLKLVGYSTDNIDRLSCFDGTFENSKMIRGMKLNSDNTFSRYANTLSDDEINDIIKLTEKKIIEAMDEILLGHFPINPKILDKENVSCKYCKFKDICYVDEKDKIYLKSEEGDIDAKMD